MQTRTITSACVKLVSTLVLFLAAQVAQGQQQFVDCEMVSIIDATTIEIAPIGPKGKERAIKVAIAYLRSPIRGREGHSEGVQFASKILRNRRLMYKASNEPRRDGLPQIILYTGPTKDYGVALAESGWAERASKNKPEYRTEENRAIANGDGLWGSRFRKSVVQ